MENHGAPIPKKSNSPSNTLVISENGLFSMWIKGFKFQELSLIVGA